MREVVIGVHKPQKPLRIIRGFCVCLLISWQRLTLPRVTAVPSALAGLTSLFGMVRGVHRRYNHHKIFIVRYRTIYNISLSHIGIKYNHKFVIKALALGKL